MAFFTCVCILPKVIGCIMVPQDAYILIPGTYKGYFIWQKDFTDVIRLRTWQWRDHPRLLKWVPHNHWDLYKRKEKIRETDNGSRELKMLTVLASKMPMNRRMPGMQLGNTEKTREQILPQTFQKPHSSVDIPILAPVKPILIF